MLAVVPAASRHPWLPPLALGLVLALATGCGASKGEPTSSSAEVVESNLPNTNNSQHSRIRSRDASPQPDAAHHPSLPTASLPSETPAAVRPSSSNAQAPSTVPQASSQGGQWVSVQRETLRTYYPAIGRLVARQRTKLGPQVSGRVEEILVDVGDTVTRGQVLLRLDPELSQIEVKQREADVAAAKITLADAELNYQRMENLWKKPDGQEPSIPKKLFDDAKTRLEASTAAVRQAEEALQHARERLDECVIRSPYDGVVTERLVDEGESVNSAPVTHLLEIAEVSTLELEFSLPQVMLSKIHEGTPVLFRAEGVPGDDEIAEVETVFPMVDEATRTFRCRVLVDNTASRYLPGLLVQVRVLEQEVEDALCVPRASVLQLEGSPTVLVRNGEAPERRRIQLALQAGERVAITEGLVEGEEVWVPGEARS